MRPSGVNLESDDDHSVLAFTDASGQQGNSWGDSWRGNNQRGTIWCGTPQHGSSSKKMALITSDHGLMALITSDCVPSRSLFNDDYKNARGWGSVQGYPGYKRLSGTWQPRALL